MAGLTTMMYAIETNVVDAAEDLGADGRLHRTAESNRISRNGSHR